jgi:peptide deformylase
MAIREIVTTENPVLRTKATKMRAFTPMLQTLIDDMIESMRAAPGVGLAAPQVGESQRVIVVEYAEGSDEPDAEARKPKLYVVVNPEIVRHSPETVRGNEACLSVPGLFGEVERFQSVTVKGLNRHGRPFRLKASDWMARIFQHEIDHLDGVLYIDRATKIWRIEDAEPGTVPPAD